MLRDFRKDLTRLINKYPNREALVSALENETILSYEQTEKYIFKSIKFLENNGIKEGDTIGSVLPNSIESCILILTCIYAGINFAPLHCDATSKEFKKWLLLIKPKAVLHNELINDHINESVIENNLKAINFNLPTIKKEKNNSYENKFTNISRIYLFTSGTTGDPKSIVIDSNRLWSAGLAFTSQHSLTTRKINIFWNYLPHSYLGGIFNLL